MTDFKPAIILANPQMGENIGAAARAMLNFGLTDLRLVNPRDGWPNPRADSLAADAFDHMPPAQVFDTLAEAVADLNMLYATTARRRDLVKPVFTPRGAAEDTLKRQHEGQRCGFVFGAEQSGMSNDEIALCQAIINIPTNPDFSSLNLGQAVLLIANEVFQAGDDTPHRALDYNDSTPAPQEELEHFINRLEDELDAGRFFQSQDLRPTMMRNIRSLFLRAEPSAQEVRTLQGIVSALIKKKTPS